MNLGVAYLLGDGVRRDTGLAEDLFSHAYAEKNGLAAYPLGQMYSLGFGLKQDEAAGERWYGKGAKLHDPRAEFQLANMLWHRQTDPGNVKRAVKLLRESSATGLGCSQASAGRDPFKAPGTGLFAAGGAGPH